MWGAFCRYDVKSRGTQPPNPARAVPDDSSEWVLVAGQGQEEADEASGDFADDLGEVALARVDKITKRLRTGGSVHTELATAVLQTTFVCLTYC